MFTVHFNTPRLRADFARFDTEAETAQAVAHLIHVRFKDRALEIRVRRTGETVYSFSRV